MITASAKPPAIALWWWPMPSTGTLVFTASVNTKMPITIDGKPFSTSSHNRICSPDANGRELADEDRGEDAHRQGDRVATPTRSSEPASAGAIPPLPPKKSELGPLMKKSRLIAPTPRLPTDQMTTASTAIARAAASTAEPSATRLTSSRRRPRPVALSEIGSGSISRRPSAGTRSA